LFLGLRYGSNYRGLAYQIQVPEFSPQYWMMMMMMMMMIINNKDICFYCQYVPFYLCSLLGSHLFLPDLILEKGPRKIIKPKLSKPRE
jgi:hypothetical protein